MIEVRTLHAMARQVLLDSGRPVQLLPDRLPLLRAARRRAMTELPAVADGDHPPPQPPDPAVLDTIVSAWKVEGRTPPPQAAAAVDAFAALMAIRGQIDFDDLVVGAVAALEADPQLRARWQTRFSHLCVDEFQDVDAAQLRLVKLLAAPEDNLFVVGDDDQTIYAWRQADVRRILDFGGDPEVDRVMLATNYRCPVAIVEASARLIGLNAERFAKPIRAAPGARLDPACIGVVNTQPRDWADRLAALSAHEAAAGRTCCVLGRTRADVEPMLRALVRAGIPHATSLQLPLDAAVVVRLLSELAGRRPLLHPFHALREVRAALGWRRGDPAADALSDDDQAAIDAALGWAVGFSTVEAYVAAAEAMRDRLAFLRRADALVEVGTVHAAKGREWQTVVLLGFEEDRFPNRRALLGHRDPGRALEEERRLAYVALTRATRRLILALDPTRPSRFLAEMGYRPTSGATTAR